MKDTTLRNTTQEKKDETPRKCFTLRGGCRVAGQAADQGRHGALAVHASATTVFWDRCPFRSARWSRFMPMYGRRSFTDDRSPHSTGEADGGSVLISWAGAES